MHERKASRICLMLAPLLVVCLLAAGGGRAYATVYNLLTLRPGPWGVNDEDICRLWQNATDEPHWIEVSDGDSSTYIANPYTNNGAQDAYQAEIDDSGGGWENQPGTSYTRQLTAIGKCPSPSGSGSITVEVWELYEDPTECNADLQNPNLSDIASLLDTYYADWEDVQSWTPVNDVLQGAGTDPTDGEGVILRITAECDGTAQVYVHGFHILYRKWAP